MKRLPIVLLCIGFTFPVGMSCCTTLVRPKSSSPVEKIWSYWLRRVSRSLRCWPEREHDDKSCSTGFCFDLVRTLQNATMSTSSSTYPMTFPFRRLACGVVASIRMGMSPEDASTTAWAIKIPTSCSSPLCENKAQEDNLETLSPGRLNLPRAMTSLVLLSNRTSCASITEQRSWPTSRATSGTLPLGTVLC